MDAFEHFINDFAAHNNIELELDEAGGCKLLLSETLCLHLEKDQKTGENLLMIIPLGEVLPGSYRKEVFKRALMANSKAAPRYGTFAYSQPLQQLIIFEALSLEKYSVERVSDYLEKFIHRGSLWLEALHSQDLPALPTEASSPKPNGGGMLGL